MQALAWFGFAVGLALLLVTGSSVVKTLLIPRNLSSAIGTAVARTVLAVYRLVTARVDDVPRREQILASGAPAYLITLLFTWIACLYVAWALMLVPFTGGNMVRALRLSGSSLFTLGFATPAGAEPYAIVFAAAGSGIGIAAHLDLPPALWSGTRPARLGQGTGRPSRPAHREPEAPDDPAGTPQRGTDTPLRMPG